MQEIELEWDDPIEEHIARHGVEPEEVEEVLEEDYLLFRAREGRYGVLGQAASGRYLFIVLVPQGGPRFRVVTARDATDAEKRRYRRR